MQNSMWLHLGLSKTPRVSKAQNVLKNKKHLKRERERERERERNALGSPGVIN